MKRRPVTTALLAVVLALMLGVNASAQPSSGDVQWIEVAAGDGHALTAAVARPGGAGPFPAVVILHGVEGFRPHYVELARALADAGFIGVAAGWFAGSRGPAGGAGFADVIPCPKCPSLDNPLQKSVPHVAALLEAARKLPGARADRAGLFGQSRGADTALLAAANGSRVEALVLSGGGYGRVRDGQPMMETSATLAAPLLILHATADTVVPVGDARAYEQKLRTLGKPVEAQYVENAVHQMPFRPETQARVREMIVTFLRARLGGRS